MIEVSKVSKAYGRTTVVDDVSLSVPRGGVVALVGPNGAGKSTLLSVMSRLMAPTRGTVTLDGLDVARAAGDDLARRLAILRQDNQFAARLTVEDLIAFGRFPYSKGRLTEEDRGHIQRVIDYLELEPFRHRFLDEVSGGQRQRAFIAMVLCQDTDYILLDEPLNNLDIKHAVAMMRLFRHTADALEKTVVVVLHDINFASCYADRIIAMRDGRVVHDGPPERIIRPEVIRDVYDLETTVQEISGQRVVLYYR